MFLQEFGKDQSMFGRLFCRSLKARYIEFLKSLNEKNWEIVHLQETWMNSGKDYLKFNGYKQLTTNAKGKRGGGTMTLIREDIKYKRILTLNEEEDLECIFIELQAKKNNTILIGNIYAHPRGNSRAMTKLRNIMENFKGRMFISGDFNAHHKEWSKGKENIAGKCLKEMIETLGVETINNPNEPTHYNKSNNEFNSPDICMVNKDALQFIKEWKVGEDIGSDHLPIETTIIVEVLRSTRKNRSHWCFNKCDPKKFEGKLIELLKPIEEERDYSFENFNNALKATAKSTCKRTKANKPKGNPWWNEECKKAVKNRSKARRELYKSNTKINKELYKMANWKARKTINRAKRQYWNKHTSELSLLDAYKKIRASKRSGRIDLCLVDLEGKVMENNKEAANLIAKYFANIGDGGKPITVIRSKNDKMKLEDLDELNREISIDEIMEVVKKSKIRKAEGCDEVHPFMIKFGGEKVIEWLFKLFNLIFDGRVAPVEWNMGIIIPIPKVSTSKVRLDKFRPISLLPVVGKIMEKIVTKRLTDIAEKCEWLPKFQHGFRRKKSTLNNLIELQNVIHEAFNRKEMLLAVFLDVKKAYDCVEREQLYEILKGKGLSGKILDWLKVFLNDRKAKVVFNNTHSDIFTFKHGVPQGSPLSPLLFNIYLGDLDVVIKSGISQFADDLVLWIKGSDLTTIGSKMNKKLTKINNYLTKKNLTISPGKSVATLFTRKNKIPEKPNIFIGGSIVEYKDSAKYLGLILDRKMTWKHQIGATMSKARSRMGELRNTINTYKLSHDTSLTLYKTNVRPVLEYGSEVWGDTCETNLNRLDSIEHMGITAALGVNRLAKRTETNLEAKILPLKIRRKRKLIETFRRDSIEWNVEELRNKWVKKRRWKNYKDKILETLKEFKLSVETAKVIKRDDLDKIVINQWKILVQQKRKEGGIFHDSEFSTKYKVFSKKREIQRIWHQSRLNVIPTNDFLFRIKCSGTNRCRFDNNKETNKHFLLECKGYKRIQDTLKIEMKEEDDHKALKVLLNEDRPPPQKRKISVEILKQF